MYYITNDLHYEQINDLFLFSIYQFPQKKK